MNLVSATRFKRLNQQARRADLGVRKQMIAPAEQLAGDMRALRFTLSTGCVDREMDCIDPEGWNLDNYRRNPVVLWNHDAYSLPIGRGFDLGLIDAALKGSVEFVPTDIPIAGELGDAVYRLAQSGFIAATSVGFRPLTWDYTEDPARGGDTFMAGIDFHTHELVEFSIVTVPANPEALIEPADAGTTASDTPPTSGEELTHFNQQAIRARAHRRRVLQLLRLQAAG